MQGLKMNRRMPSKSAVAARVGILLYDSTVEVDAILIETVQRVRGRGIAVGGLLQRLGERPPNGRHSTWLDDIATGQTIRLDQPRGPGARACTLDADALARAACLLRSAAEAGHGLIIVNRFGHAEAHGGGMRAEIAEAICSGAAVLIAVRLTRLGALEDFLGGPASVLLPSAAAIADWAECAAATRQPAAAE
jgi:molybdate transport system ATP-binding protein